MGFESFLHAAFCTCVSWRQSWNHAVLARSGCSTDGSRAARCGLQQELVAKRAAAAADSTHPGKKWLGPHTLRGFPSSPCRPMPQALRAAEEGQVCNTGECLALSFRAWGLSVSTSCLHILRTRQDTGSCKISYRAGKTRSGDRALGSEFLVLGSIEHPVKCLHVHPRFGFNGESSC